MLPLGCNSNTNASGLDESGSEWRQIDLSKFTGVGALSCKDRVLDKLWRTVGQRIYRCSLLGFSRGNQVRAALLRLFGATVGTNVVLRPCEITTPRNIHIGNHAWIGEGAVLYSLAQIEIGDNACVSQHAYLCTGSHDVTDPFFGLVKRSIVVRAGAWVCANTFVGPGVTVYEGAVAAAGSVVVRDLPAMSVSGGNPCVFIKKRQLRA
ncbi:Putative acetyltransferase [Rosistilla carotiformis]|uniref:Acetyltransferase n=1 Tax=Rosistilla carotiformis TaxID=2528017 RepID=A0A518JNX8_9BACT|nr:Putative acetyltransferase [Rosistilla carotiformis]